MVFFCLFCGFIAAGIAWSAEQAVFEGCFLVLRVFPGPGAAAVRGPVSAISCLPGAFGCLSA